MKKDYNKLQKMVNEAWAKKEWELLKDNPVCLFTYQLLCFRTKDIGTVKKIAEYCKVKRETEKWKNIKDSEKEDTYVNGLGETLPF